MPLYIVRASLAARGPWRSSLFLRCPRELERLAHAGYVLLAVTNQPEIARGQVSREMVDAINARLARDLPVQEFFVCAHEDADRCQCRKPLPGLLLQAADTYHIDLACSYMVGDRWKDVAAGHAGGCQTILVDQGWAEMAGHAAAHHTVASLPAAAAVILASHPG